MTQRDDGGPAFPVSTKGYPEGMSLRDYFAAHAPAMPPGLREVAKLAEKCEGRDTSDYGAFARWEAAWRWSYADAMLKARQS